MKYATPNADPSWDGHNYVMDVTIHEEEPDEPHYVLDEEGSRSIWDQLREKITRDPLARCAYCGKTEWADAMYPVERMGDHAHVVQFLHDDCGLVWVRDFVTPRDEVVELLYREGLVYGVDAWGGIVLWEEDDAKKAVYLFREAGIPHEDDVLAGKLKRAFS